IGLALFHLADQQEVVVESDRRSEQHDKVIVGCDLDGLRRRDLVGAGVEQPASGQHTRRISKPHRIPIGFDLARHRPARTRPAVKIREARRIQQQGLHHIRHTNPPSIPGSIYAKKRPPTNKYSTRNRCPAKGKACEDLAPEPLASIPRFRTRARARARTATGAALSKYTRQLAGGAEQLELGLLAFVFGVEERQPLVAFLEASFFHVAQAGASLLELRLDHVEV